MKPIRLMRRKHAPGVDTGLYTIRLNGAPVYHTTGRPLVRHTVRLMRQAYDAGCADTVAAMKRGPFDSGTVAEFIKAYYAWNRLKLGATLKAQNDTFRAMKVARARLKGGET